MVSDTHHLLGARRAAFRNRLKLDRGNSILALSVLAALAVASILGWLAAPSLMTAAESTVTPRLGERPPIAGGSALEAAFWLTALASSLSSFRVMELLFRREDVRVVSLLPLSARALFWDRSLAATYEALGFGLFLTAFFAPLLFHGQTLVAAVCIALSVFGLLSTAFITMAVVMWMGSQFGSSDSGMPGDAYGGQGGAFIYAPGISLGISVVSLLILQLAFREVLYAEAVTRAAQLGGGIVLATVVVALVTTYRTMASSYHEAAAFFHEAESIGFEPPMEYQKSAMTLQLLGERLLPASAALMYRREVLQGSRRNTLVRYLYAFVLFVLLIAIWRFDEVAVPTWVSAIAPALLFALVNPWRRLARKGYGASHSTYLPVSRRDESMSRTLFVLREMLPIGLASGALALAFRGTGMDELMVAATAIGSLVAMAGIMSLLDTFKVPDAVRSMAPVLAALVLSGLTLGAPAVSLGVGLLLSLLLFVRPPAEPVRLEVA